MRQEFKSFADIQSHFLYLLSIQKYIKALKYIHDKLDNITFLKAAYKLETHIFIQE